jgi:hypothetical protein
LSKYLPADIQKLAQNQRQPFILVPDPDDYQRFGHQTFGHEAAGSDRFLQLPAVAIFIAWVWLGETPELSAWLGGGLILMGVLVVNWWDVYLRVPNKGEANYAEG